MPDPEDTPLPISIVESPVPAPACVHEHATVTTIGRVAVVRCDSCPAQWTTDVIEPAAFAPLLSLVIA